MKTKQVPTLTMPLVKSQTLATQKSTPATRPTPKWTFDVNARHPADHLVLCLRFYLSADAAFKAIEDNESMECLQSVKI